MDVATQIWNNIRRDLYTNVIPRAWLVFIDPELFDPPFLSVLGDSRVYLQLVAGMGDVLYILVRYAVATAILVCTMVATSFFMILLYVSVTRRWRLVVVMVNNMKEEFFG